MPIGKINGEEAAAFGGVFNGNNASISNLKRSDSSSDCLGLFGTTYRAAIQNVYIENVSIYSSYHSEDSIYGVGALVGWSSETTITNCSSTGVITGSDSATNDKDMNRNYFGGLVGGVDAGSITSSHSSCSVSGKNGDTGGLAGYVHRGCELTDCYATGIVTGKGDVCII